MNTTTVQDNINAARSLAMDQVSIDIPNGVTQVNWNDDTREAIAHRWNLYKAVARGYEITIPEVTSQKPEKLAMYKTSQKYNAIRLMTINAMMSIETRPKVVQTLPLLRAYLTKLTEVAQDKMELYETSDHGEGCYDTVCKHIKHDYDLFAQTVKDLETILDVPIDVEYRCLQVELRAYVNHEPAMAEFSTEFRKRSKTKRGTMSMSPSMARNLMLY